jgi:hypothetical protein
MQKLTLKLGKTRTLELESGTSVRIRAEGGDCNGSMAFDVRFDGCTWAEIVAIGRALAPEGISAMEFERAVGDVEVVEPEEGAS